MSENMIIFIASTSLALLGAIIVLLVRLTWWLSSQFSEMRKLSYKLHGENDKRLVRLELWANRRGFQPGIDNPFDFNGGGREHI